MGAVCSGSMLFASILNLSVMLGNYLQQMTSADDIFRCIFFLGALRLNIPGVCISRSFYTEFVSHVRQLFAADDFSRRHFQMHFFSWRFKVKHSRCLHFSKQNIEQSRDLTYPLGGLMFTSANEWLCLLCLCDVIIIS